MQRGGLNPNIFGVCNIHTWGAIVNDVTVKKMYLQGLVLKTVGIPNNNEVLIKSESILK